MTDLLAHLRLDETAAPEGIRAASLEVPGIDARSLWYESLDGPLDPDTGVDPFVLGSLLYFMEHGHDLHVHGTVSRRLLQNVDELQMCWLKWQPGRYSKIAISADDVSPDAP
ncbi:hypothetical protein [Arthrobacter pigmenti]